MYLNPASKFGIYYTMFPTENHLGRWIDSLINASVYYNLTFEKHTTSH